MPMTGKDRLREAARLVDEGRGTYFTIRYYAREKQFKRHPYCRYCGCEFTKLKHTTMDHIRPLSRGGKHCDENLILCCRLCNEAKGDRTLSGWLNHLRRQLRRVEVMLAVRGE